MLVRLLRQPAFVAAVLCTIAGFVLHLVAIRQLPLFLAQAAIAISLAITALLAVRIFGEPLTAPECAAVAAVCVGLALLTAASGRTGDHPGAGPLLAGLLAALISVAGVGAVAARSPGGLATSVLSASAGLCFATTAIAARLLPGLSPAALLTAPATYLLLAAGPLGFLLYSVALQRGAVTAATAPMIVMQTVVPALLGVWVLGDAIRAGWHLPAAVGLVCTLVGAVSLARFDGRRTQSRTAGGRLTRQ